MCKILLIHTFRKPLVSREFRLQPQTHSTLYFATAHVPIFVHSHFFKQQGFWVAVASTSHSFISPCKCANVKSFTHPHIFNTFSFFHNHRHIALTFLFPYMCNVSNFAHLLTVKYFGTLFGTKQQENDILVLKTTLEHAILF